MGICMWSNGRDGNEWNYLHLVPTVRPYAQWEPFIDGVYELIGKPGWPSKSLSNRPDGSYATKDLWAQHPTDPNKWKYYGRRDDILVLSNGEKANPVTLELHVRENPYVKEVAVCGSQRAHLGMLVIPCEKAAGMGQNEIIETIWKSIEQENKQMPAYARISKEMIAILPVDQDFPKTDKGTTIRAAFYAKFADRIEQLYQDFEVQNTREGLELSEVELKEFIKKELIEVLMLDNPSGLQDETDFFSLGLDSLGATQIRAKIVREIKTGGKASQNIVFEQPTLAKLAGYLYRLRAGENEVVYSQIDLLKALIEKYSNFPQHVPGKSNPDGDYIVSFPHNRLPLILKITNTPLVIDCYWCHRFSWCLHCRPACSPRFSQESLLSRPCYFPRERHPAHNPVSQRAPYLRHTVTGATSKGCCIPL